MGVSLHHTSIPPLPLQMGRTEIVQLLVDNGCDLEVGYRANDVGCKTPRTPLHQTCQVLLLCPSTVMASDSEVEVLMLLVLGGA